MSQTPNQGGPPAEGDPRGSPQGGGWQPPQEPDPQYPVSGSPSSTPGPQQPGWHPPPEGSGPQQPGWHPPPEGSGPQYPGGWQPQGAQQYPGGSPPPYPPPGGPGAYGHPPYGPPPPQGGKRNGLIIGVVIAVGVLIAGVLVVLGVNMMRGGDGDNKASAPGPSASGAPAPSQQEPSAEESGQADVPASACLPYEPVVAPFGFDFSTACDSANAFWRVTNSSDTTQAAVTPDGVLEDPQVAGDLCGDEYTRLEFGELWKDWYFTYDTNTFTVEQLVCVEALGNPDEAGRTPIMPDVGSCFDDSDRWWTVPCDRPEALYVATDTVAIDPPRTMSLDEAGGEAAACSDGTNYWQVVDAAGRTTDVLCGNTLLLA
jgi:hypothetical protein